MILLALLLLSTPAVKPASQTFAELSHKAAQAREANRLDEAVAFYKRSVAIKPDWTEGWWYLGTIAYDRDQYAAGRDAFLKVVSRDAKNARAYALLGLCQYRTGELRDSFGNLEKARQLGLKNSPDLMKVVRFHAALLLNKAGQFEEAFLLIHNMLRDGEDSPKLTEAAGISGTRKKILPEEITPEERPLIMQMGRALLAGTLHRTTEAEQFFQALLTEYPKTPSVHYAYGLFLLMTTDADKGLRELKQELEITPDHVPAMISIAFEYLKRDDPQSALKYARKAADIDPKSFVVHNALGRAMVDAGDVQNGIEELQLAVKLAPDSPQNRIALASAYAKAGQSKEAAQERAEFLRLKKLSEAPAEAQ